MKKSELIFTAILVPVDFLMLLLAGIFAYYTRYTPLLTEFKPIIYDLPFPEYFIWVLVVIPFWLIIFALNGNYNIKKFPRFTEDLYRTFVSVSTGVTAILIYSFFSNTIFYSRYIILAAWIFSILFIAIGRLFVRFLQMYLYKFDYGTKRVILFGTNTSCKNLATSLNQPKTGYKVIRKFSTYSVDIKNKIINLHNKKNIDQIIQCDPNLPKKSVQHILNLSDLYKIDFCYIPNLFETQVSNINTTTLFGLPIVEIKRTPLDGWKKIFKRIFDFIFSVLLLVTLLPLFLIIAIAIKLDSRGPVFVKLTRINNDGEFKLYKFRSMVKDAHKMKKKLLKYSERKGPLFKMKDDPRITRVGKIIRLTRIDELPQLFNVIKDQMSLIGPRPHEPEEVAKYKRHHFKVLSIKPGMTGMAQVSGAGELDFEEEVKLDSYYIENWTFKLDLQILLKTIIIVLTRKYAS